MARKLQYFDIGGLAESIRYILHYGGLEFEDVRHPRTEWPIQSIKDTLPYGQMPLYEENGRTLNQSMAIARYVASQAGLLPSDPWEQAQLDAVVLNIYDLIAKVRPHFVEKDAQKKQENKKALHEDIDFFLSRFERELKAGNGYFGGKLSWADFILVSTIQNMDLYLQETFEKNYPLITALIAKVHSLPAIKAYVAKRGPYPNPFQ